MSKILVTGSKGQLGRELQKIAGPDFVFTDRSELDITDEEQIKHYLESGNYQYVVNCAAYTAVDRAETEVEQCNLVNVEAVRGLARQCKAQDCVLIHISSDYVYNPDNEYPIDEKTVCNPQGAYASSKLKGEQIAIQHSSDNIIIRTSWVYSSFGHNFVKTMLRLSEERNLLSIVHDQIGSPTYAGDLAAAICTIIAKKGRGGTYNFSNLGYISWAEFAAEIFKQSQVSVETTRIPSSDYPTPAHRPKNSRLIKSKIADDFGVELRFWKRSLAKCLEEIDN